MRKSNVITLSFLCIACIAVTLYSQYTESESLGTDITDAVDSTNTDAVTPPLDGVQEGEAAFPPTSDGIENDEPAPTPDINEVLTPADMDDALFIGDSRTLGIMEYSGITEADYFCGSGMSVFNIEKEKITVPNVGKVTLEELMQAKRYGKVYIMLGINELGYNLQSILDKYSKLLELVKASQPDAAIFIQANLHVTEKRSQSDKYINNAAMDRLNSALCEIADNKRIFYLDANYLFDDEGGSLSPDKTSDNAHLYAKYYAEWGQWIREETSRYVKGK